MPDKFTYIVLAEGATNSGSRGVIHGDMSAAFNQARVMASRYPGRAFIVYRGIEKFVADPSTPVAYSSREPRFADGEYHFGKWAVSDLGFSNPGRKMWIPESEIFKKNLNGLYSWPEKITREELDYEDFTSAFTWYVARVVHRKCKTPAEADVFFETAAESTAGVQVRMRRQVLEQKMKELEEKYSGVGI